MQFLIIVGADIHEHALKQAETAPRAAAALYAPLVEDAERWVARLWAAAKDALKAAALKGYDLARQEIDFFEATLAQASLDLKSEIDKVIAALVDRLNAYLRDVLNGALARVESKIKIGDQNLILKNLTLQHTFKLSSSLSLSVTNICQLVGEGQLAVAAEYGASS